MPALATNPVRALRGSARPRGSGARRLGAIAAGLLSLPAGADGPPVVRVLIDRGLQEREVAIVAISSERITYEDAAGIPRDEPIDQVVAMIPARRGAGTPAPLPALWLIDGQRLSGAPRMGEPPADSVEWQHPVFGSFPVPLDSVSRIMLRKTRRGTEPAGLAEADRDVVTLVNSDRITGFLESFGPTVRIDAEGQAREVSRLRVAHAAFANPAVPAHALTLWLADGSVVRAASLQTSRSGEVHLVPDVPGLAGRVPRPPVEAPPDSAASPLRLGDIVAVAFDAGAIVPLASIPPAAQRPAGERRWAEPVLVGGPDTAVLGAADVTLPGPMTVEWILPDGARRFSCEAELPPDLWSWGDCEAVFALVQPRREPVELARERLHAGQPRAAVNIEVGAAGARLRITLEAARYGPIQDRVILRRPIILMNAAR